MIMVDKNGVAELPVNKDVIARWADELESGKYKQGTGVLHTVNHGIHQFCCLGVLCEMAVEEGLIPPGVYSEAGADYAYGEKYATFTHLPYAVAEWAMGSNYRDVDLLDEHGVAKGAVVRNDEDGWSFAEIAASIRRTYLKDEAAA